jgi:hypothetical protein
LKYIAKKHQKSSIYCEKTSKAVSGTNKFWLIV